MTRYHRNDRGEAVICSASEKPCPKDHIEANNPQEAMKHFEQLNAQEAGGTFASAQQSTIVGLSMKPKIPSSQRYKREEFEPPMAHLTQHEEKGYTDLVESRRIPEQDDPHNYTFENPDDRYLAAQERSRRLTKDRSEEHTSELQSRFDLVCRLLLE